ncbi:MAG: 4-(cytidine 5'-diphospho)-2-C-methyl-D-erythritol kinase [Desulfobacteraceae bacterium]|nr:4-(cytidine 5'-diphospho)-2-C-methyl-D-erythritol kinase [Desulfobacteraceae bacterium]
MIETYHSCAKINLFLYVTSKREDGYHNLHSLMTQIDLYDEINIDFTKDKISIVCDHPDVPENASNLAHKAARLFYRSMKTTGYEGKKGLSIEIKKKIPVGGGLGGGSSNAALILTVLNRYHKTPFSTSELMKMGLDLGADVPFFIFGTAAIAKGVGEQLEKVSNLKPYHIVLCDPGVAASTAKVYKNIDFRLTSNQKYNKYTGLNVPIRGQEFDVKGQMHNDLEESACRLYPEIKETKEEMELLLQKKVFMTGSGSSLFALFSAHDNAKMGCDRLIGKWAGRKKKIFLSSFNR